MSYAPLTLYVSEKNSDTMSEAVNIHLVQERMGSTVAEAKFLIVSLDLLFITSTVIITIRNWKKKKQFKYEPHYLDLKAIEMGEGLVKFLILSKFMREYLIGHR